jgi:hypothetical protein
MFDVPLPPLVPVPLPAVPVPRRLLRRVRPVEVVPEVVPVVPLCPLPMFMPDMLPLPEPLPVLPVPLPLFVVVDWPLVDCPYVLLLLMPDEVPMFALLSLLAAELMSVELVLLLALVVPAVLPLVPQVELLPLFWFCTPVEKFDEPVVDGVFMLLFVLFAVLPVPVDPVFEPDAYDDP